MASVEFNPSFLSYICIDYTHCTHEIHFILSIRGEDPCSVAFFFPLLNGIFWGDEGFWVRGSCISKTL